MSQAIGSKLGVGVYGEEERSFCLCFDQEPLFVDRFVENISVRSLPVVVGELCRLADSPDHPPYYAAIGKWDGEIDGLAVAFLLGNVKIVRVYNRKIILSDDTSCVPLPEVILNGIISRNQTIRNSWRKLGIKGTFRYALFWPWQIQEDEI